MGNCVESVFGPGVGFDTALGVVTVAAQPIVAGTEPVVSDATGPLIEVGTDHGTAAGTGIGIVPVGDVDVGYGVA